ncbi:MAG: LysR family transcriptional regulator [Pseudorhodobacter sp.]
MGWIEHYRIFSQVIESGSFTRAAEVLRLPRSTVSTVVATLEGRLGVRLLHRTTRRVGLTRAGEDFLVRCRALLADQTEMESMFKPLDGRISGRVGVSVPSRIGRLVLAPALPDFLRTWPGIQIDLGMSDRCVDLPGEQVDLVLRVGGLPADGLISKRIGRIEQINVASPAYLASFGIPASPADLSEHRQVGYGSPVSGRVSEWEWVEGENVRTRPVPWAVNADTAEGYIACALAGLGMIQIPAYDVADHLAKGTLVEVMRDFRPAAMPVNLALRRVQPVPRLVELFAEWFEMLLRERILR